MWFQGESDLEVVIPNFQFSVPSNSGEIWVEVNFGGSFQKRGISNTRNPIRVVILVTGEFVISKGVP